MHRARCGVLSVLQSPYCYSADYGAQYYCLCMCKVKLYTYTILCIRAFLFHLVLLIWFGCWVRLVYDAAGILGCRVRIML